MNHQELQNLIALQHIPGIGSITAKRLLESMGSATQIFAQRTELPRLVPHVQPSLVKALDCPAAHRRAEQELEFITKHHITCIGYHDEAYPTRLRECDDAPSLLYYRGNTTFNPRRVVSIIGTRKCTDYGRDLCECFVRDLAALIPDVLIVSGLAYGIDVCAHRAALKYNLPTVGVLAHGLDRTPRWTERSNPSTATTSLYRFVKCSVRMASIITPFHIASEDPGRNRSASY